MPGVVDDLAIEVNGVGLLKLPVSASQALDLRRIARPARYGRGEDTVLDRRVRDTWEVARSRVRIDKRRWSRTLLPVLDTLRNDLGLPDSCHLRAELHSMLVYEAHQFFAPHQDAEKADDMVGTLVVILPSNATGGELIVRHQGTESTYRSSRSLLTFVALYADTVHEVKPLGSGYRVVLTYKLRLAGDNTVATAAAVPASAVMAVAELVERHFAEPADVAPWRRHADPDAPPDRLWPLAERRRHHMHDAIDRLELPVEHTTRRKGSPYTLVLGKGDLVQLDHRARQRAALDLVTALDLLPDRTP